MGMSAGTSEGEPMMEINTTPLIDVMLVLLIMFIITIPVMTHAVKLDMPQKTPPSDNPVQPEVIDIEIDFDGTIIWNQVTPVTSIATLDSYFRREAAKDVQPEIHLRPNRRARYDVVANVMASAQRAKMVKMGFTNVAEFRD